MPFADRRAAGLQLATRLRAFRGSDVVAVGICRGGIPVAYEIARALRIPLEIALVRKLGIPYQSELAFGAIGEHDTRDIDYRTVRRAQISAAELTEIERLQRCELERLTALFRRTPLSSLVGRTVVLVDDGCVTGATARVACQVVRAEGAHRIVFATPAATPAALGALRDCADNIVCLEPPQPFHASGRWYRDFDRVCDEQIRDLLQLAAQQLPAPTGTEPTQAPPVSTTLTIEADSIHLSAVLAVPHERIGLVVRGLASGSSRFSPGSRFIAGLLNRAGLATVLVDLLTESEEIDRAAVFDIELLARRLTTVTRALSSRPEIAHLPIGYFGAGTSAAAQLRAAADHSTGVTALVCRAGRPDLAAEWLDRVRVPTLLLVGDSNAAMLALNRAARARMRCRSELAIIKGGTHLLERPGALDQVAAYTRDWFLDYLIPAHPDITMRLETSAAAGERGQTGSRNKV